MRGLEIGVNDYPAASGRWHECRRVCAPRSGASATPNACATMSQMSIEAAITDELTGLHNRRYMEAISASWSNWRRRAASSLRCSFSISIISSRSTTPTATIAATTCCANSLFASANPIRGIDLACRIGGEEFVVVMPETDMGVASTVAERLRRKVAAEPFQIEQGRRKIDAHDFDRHRGAGIVT